MKNFCEICLKKKIPTVLDLGFHPLCDDLKKISSKTKNTLYKIEILFCKFCITLYQKHQVKKKILFPASYHYRSHLTKDVISGMRSLVKDCEASLGSLKGKTVLDIGCNDGTLLRIFKKKKCTTIGLEPTNAYLEALKKNDEILNGYIDAKNIQIIKKKYPKIDIITFTNVFAHIENLRDLIKNLKKIINNETILIIENHYLGSIIKKKQFDTFYHEHPRTYSFQSFLKIADLLEMKIYKYCFPKRYGGNIRIIYSKKFKKYKNFKKIINKEKKFYNELSKFNNLISLWKLKKKKLIAKLNKLYGPLPAKAFPGRAAILLKLLNLNSKNIEAIYEQPASNKIGHFAPGTNIPILSDKKLKNMIKNKPIINLAWHIKKEIKNYLLKKKITNKIFNIIESSDFKK